MRMFGEATAGFISAGCWIYPACENQHDLLREDWARLRLLMTASLVFHKLRRIVLAVHEFHNDLDVPRYCLRRSGSASASGTTDW